MPTNPNPAVQRPTLLAVFVKQVLGQLLPFIHSRNTETCTESCSVRPEDGQSQLGRAGSDDGVDKWPDSFTGSPPPKRQLPRVAVPSRNPLPHCNAGLLSPSCATAGWAGVARLGKALVS